MLNSLVGQLFLVIVAAVSASGGIYSTVVSRRKVGAEADEGSARAQSIEDATWISRLNALSGDLTRLQALSDERFRRLVEIEGLITDHVSWDFKVVRILREQGIEIEDPPSLVYVRRKLEEARADIARERENGEDLQGDSPPVP